METKTIFILIAFSQISLLIGVVLFWRRIKKDKKELDRRVGRYENLIDYLIRHIFKPKFSIGEQVSVKRNDNYMFIEAIGIIVDITLPNFFDQKTYYKVFVDLKNQPIISIEEYYITTLTPPSQSHQAHSSQVQPPV
jgi:hypothetical protein